MRWLELSISAHREAVEALCELLSRYAPGGVALEEPITLLDDGQEYRIQPDQPVLVRAFLPTDGSEEEARLRIQEGIWHLGQIGPNFVGTLSSRYVDEEDWANAWKEYYHVLHVGRRVVIKPSWREYTPQPGEVVLELDPGMAFGTGLHPTTHMCLEQLEQLVQPDMRVLDVGTGSGILALTAAKLDAASVLALDISTVAVEAAQANARANGLDERVTVQLGTLLVAPASLPVNDVIGKPLVPPASLPVYDLVVANIIARVIAELAPALVASLAPGGILIASGIIDERLPLAEDALRDAGLQNIQRVQEGDWFTLVGRR
ncbi:MAG TPA: 50S ribosomal protein L11 methyltransferase [Ktedonobacterales bacterium]